MTGFIGLMMRMIGGSACITRVRLEKPPLGMSLGRNGAFSLYVGDVGDLQKACLIECQVADRRSLEWIP